MLDSMQDYVLETSIIDTGHGISAIRQGLLFKPFQEIKTMHGMNCAAEDNNIGLGLSASRDIVQGMGGDIQLECSQHGLTVFRMRTPCKIPVDKLPVADSENLAVLESNTEIKRKVATWRSEQSSLVPVPDCIAQIYGNFSSPLQQTIKEYLQQKAIDVSACHMVNCSQELEDEIKGIINNERQLAEEDHHLLINGKNEREEARSSPASQNLDKQVLTVSPSQFLAHRAKMRISQ